MTSVRTVQRAGLCAGLVALSLAFPVAARAQDEQPTEGMGLGLDLTSDTADLRPTLAVVGIDLAEGNPKRDGWILNYLATLISANAAKSGSFASVMKPDEVAAKLGDKYAEALKCVEDSCMVEIATELGVERVITAQASHAATTSALKLNAFTRATLAVESSTVDVKGPPRGDFFKKTVSALRPLFQSISGKLAKLKVTPSLESAKITLGDRELGTGAVDVKVSAGTYSLKATADGFVGQQKVTLEEGGSTEVNINLEKESPSAVASRTPSLSLDDGPAAEAKRPAVTAKAPGPAIPLDAYLRHPGPYVAAAGVVALAVGAGLGASAMATKGRAIDANGDGVIDISRSDAMAAQGQAVIANVLFAAGAVGLVGGGAWLFVSPPKGGGVAVSAGGKF